MQIAVSLDREEGGFLASVSESGGKGGRVRVGAGACSCHAPSAGPAMQQDFLGAPGWGAPGRRGQETVWTPASPPR